VTEQRDELTSRSQELESAVAQLKAKDGRCYILAATGIFSAVQTTSTD